MQTFDSRAPYTYLMPSAIFLCLKCETKKINRLLQRDIYLNFSRAWCFRFFGLQSCGSSYSARVGFSGSQEGFHCLPPFADTFAINIE